MAKKTEWTQLGISRAEYKHGVEETIRLCVCNDDKLLREIFGKMTKAAAAGA
jgi:hypothetical protein